MTVPDSHRLRLMADQELEALALRLSRLVTALEALWTPAGRRARADYLDALDAVRVEIERRETP